MITPVKEIFDARFSPRLNSLIERILRGLDYFEVNTAEQLITYNQLSFKKKYRDI